METLDSEYEQRKSENASDIESRRRLVEEASQETALLRNRLAAFNSNQGEIKENCRLETAKLEQVEKKHGKELAIEHEEAVMQRKKEALDKMENHLRTMTTVLRDYEVWRKTFKTQIDDAWAELKKLCDEPMVVADKALDECEQFRKQFEEEDGPSDAMEVQGDE